MALPPQIQAQVEQAEATLAAMNKPVEDQPIEAVVNQPEPPKAQEPEPQAPVPPAPAPQAQPDVWEHRYKSLQGRYNSDVPALQGRVKELEAKLNEAIEKLNKAAEQAPKPVEQKPVADPQDVEAFGSDLVEMVQRTAERLFGNAARSIQEQAAQFDVRLKRLEESLQGTTQTVAYTAEQAFFDRLSKLVPDWEDVNVNEAFIAWLAEVDPIYGQPRQAALDLARQSLNAERAAAVFKTFQATLEKAPKPSPVEKQVSPKAAASSAPTPVQKPVFTQKQVTDFYNDVARGAYKGRQDEMLQIEQSINAAMAEGRIR